MRVLTFHIRNNATGEVRKYVDEYEDGYPDDAVDYMWTEGNYACDCNRGDFWAQAGNEPEVDTECGDTRFSVPFATTEDGRVLPLDEAP